MSLAIISSYQQTFSGRATYNSGSPGNLGTVENGSIVAYAGGPRLSSDTSANSYGWSGDPQNSQFYHALSIPSAQYNAGGMWLFSCFFNFKSISFGSHNLQMPSAWYDTVGDGVFNCFINYLTGNFAYSLNFGSAIDTGVAAPMNQWYEYLLAMETIVNNTSYNVVWQYRPAGASRSTGWVSIANLQPVTISYANPRYLMGGTSFSYNNASPEYRYGMPTLCSMTNFTTDLTAAIPNSVIDPNLPYGGYPWKVDLVNGSDSNDGITTAYLTPTDTYARFFAAPTTLCVQTANSGVATGNSYNITGNSAIQCRNDYLAGNLAFAGDTITINNNSGLPIPMGGSFYPITSNGLSFLSSGGKSSPVWIDCTRVIANSGWSNTFGSVYVNSVGAGSLMNSTYNTYSAITTYSVIYENGKTLQMLSGSTIAQAANNFVNGSAWTDGTKAYVQTLSGGNPATDGNEYTYSNGAPLFVFNQSSKLISGINFYGTEDYQPSLAGAITAISQANPGKITSASHGLTNGQVVLIVNVGGMTQLNGNSYTITVVDTNNFTIGVNTTGYGSYTSGGGWEVLPAAQGGYGFQFESNPGELEIADTCYFSHWGKHALSHGAASDSNSRSCFLNLIAESGSCQGGFGVQSAFVDQSVAGSGQESDYYNCSTGRGNCQLIGSSSPVISLLQGAWLTHSQPYTSFTFENCDFSTSNGIGVQTASPLTFTGGKLRYAGYGNAPGTNQSVFNEVTIINPIALVGVYNSCIITQSATISSNGSNDVSATMNYVTWDYSSIAAPAVTRGTNGVTLSLNSCLLLTGNQAIVSGWGSGDTFSSTSCEVQTSSSSNTYLASYGSSPANLTLAQAKTDGYDTGSVTETSAAIVSWNYTRTAQSSITYVSSNTADFTGITWGARKTIGAYEYVSNPVNAVSVASAF